MSRKIKGKPTPVEGYSQTTLSDQTMRILALDIGTNSTLHLVAEIVGTNLTVIERGIAANGLGSSIHADGRIPEDAIATNARLIAGMVKRGEFHACQRRGAVGTQALRDATNRDRFVSMCNQAGISLEILTPEAEALLGWTGVFGYDGPKDSSALIDLGGGSCELSWGAASSPVWFDSIPLGAVSLSRRHFKTDPPLRDEISAARREAGATFSRWRGRLPADARVTGVAGTITAIAALELQLPDYREGVLESIVLTVAQISKWSERLISLSYPDRSALPGMPPARAHSINAGALILDELMSLLSLKEITVSEWGVLFGLAFRLAEKP